MFRWAARKQAWTSLFDNPTEEIDLRNEILPREYEGSERKRVFSEDEILELARKLPVGLHPLL